MDCRREDSKTVQQAVSAEPRPRWQKPQLEVHGDVRQLTMGPTPGVGESANAGIYRP